MSERGREKPRRTGSGRTGSGRAAVRAASVAAAAVCALQAIGPAWLAVVFPSLSPFTGLLAAVAGAVSVLLWAAAAVAAVCLFLPRFFCRWICPAGACFEAVGLRARRRAWVGRVPRVGVGLVLVGAGAAVLGYPLFGWLDPLVMFQAFFAFFRPHAGVWEGGAAAGLPLLILAALLAPGLWCGRLCPLGATQDLLRGAVTWRRAGGDAASRASRGGGAGRRVFLGLGAGAAYRLLLPPERTEARAEAIRPPASGTAARFTRLCARCGNCVRACPSNILHGGGVGAGLAGVLAPEVRFGEEYCPVTCTVCGQVCPTGAIPRFTRQNKFREPMGCAKVDHALCLLAEGRECGSCVAACPEEALDFAWDPDELVSRVTVDANACTGCGYCEYVCPAVVKAIRIRAPRRKEEAG
ncbi:MAG: 4Fe-4S dicluster domain-containing protein [Kiritimatiellia bacterium]|nr:4Fe-4S dicluster domain-containing protein [Kiritimatiellia bacterium]